MLDKLPEKNYGFLLWSGIAALLTVSLFMMVNTYQKIQSPATGNTVSFSGEGKVVATPDIAVIDLTILTEGKTSKDAQDQNSEKSNSLTKYLKGQGIDEKDIKTTGYNIYPQYSYPVNEQPRISGYQVNQSIQIKVRDLDNVNKVLDGVVTAGVNQINNLQLTIDDPDALLAQAREEAIKSAKEKASSLKSQLGISLGRVVNFSESTNGQVPGPILYKDGGGYGGGGGAPSVPVGQNEVVVNVVITYQIR